MEYTEASTEFQNMCVKYKRGISACSEKCPIKSAFPKSVTGFASDCAWVFLYHPRMIIRLIEEEKG